MLSLSHFFNSFPLSLSSNYSTEISTLSLSFKFSHPQTKPPQSLPPSISPLPPSSLNSRTARKPSTSLSIRQATAKHPHPPTSPRTPRALCSPLSANPPTASTTPPPLTASRARPHATTFTLSISPPQTTSHCRSPSPLQATPALPLHHLISRRPSPTAPSPSCSPSHAIPSPTQASLSVHPLARNKAASPSPPLIPIPARHLPPPTRLRPPRAIAIHPNLTHQASATRKRQHLQSRNTQAATLTFISLSPSPPSSLHRRAAKRRNQARAAALLCKFADPMLFFPQCRTSLPVYPPPVHDRPTGPASSLQQDPRPALLPIRRRRNLLPVAAARPSLPESSLTLPPCRGVFP